MIKSRTSVGAIIIILFFLAGCIKNNTSLSVSIVEPSAQASAVSYNSILKDIIYARNKNWLNEDEDLALDIYLPPQTKKNEKFPLVLYIHGGSFTSGDKAASQTECALLAQNGFTAVAFNYRLGWETPSQELDATYRCLQDTHAALRFLVANAYEYSIDTRWIFVEGASAGAITALNAQYMSQDSADVYYKGCSKRLGSLYNAGNDLDNQYIIRGIASLWGSLLSPYLITKETYVPTIFFHGEKDNVIPWDEGYFYNDPNYRLSYGSKSLYDRISFFYKSTVAHIDPDGKHGVYTTEFIQPNVACFFNSIIDHKPQHGIYYTEVSNCE